MKLFHRNYRTELLPIVPILFVLLLLTVLVSPLTATPVTWDLTGVTLNHGDEWYFTHPRPSDPSDGSTLTGFFTYDASNPIRFGTWSITAAVNPLTHQQAL